MGEFSGEIFTNFYLHIISGWLLTKMGRNLEMKKPTKKDLFVRNFLTNQPNLKRQMYNKSSDYTMYFQGGKESPKPNFYCGFDQKRHFRVFPDKLEIHGEFMEIPGFSENSLQRGFSARHSLVKFMNA